MASYFDISSEKLIHTPEDEILGALSRNHQFALEERQKRAWEFQITHLKHYLKDITNLHIFFEFSIPRINKRVDVIILKDNLILVVEYKVGMDSYYNSDIDQVIDYALDLKYFHEESHNALIVPILCCTESDFSKEKIIFERDNISKPIKTNGKEFDRLINSFPSSIDSTIDPMLWHQSVYKPTPTIIEAAQALYRGHEVDNISRNEAGIENLSGTAEYISKVIDDSKINNKKSICFITGVPGSGKTLAGLNIANIRKKIDNDENAVFLSGNGSLVKVLQEALAMDSLDRNKHNSKKDALRESTVFIQNIHNFRDSFVGNLDKPFEKVVIFDEAQRAWDMNQTSQFMKNKKGVLDFNMSEAEFLLSVMKRHEDWCVVVCLIGSGQEIFKGEAGIDSWFKTLNENPGWEIHISDQLNDESFFNKEEKEELLPKETRSSNKLHLSTSLRSFRAESLSSFVEKIINGDSLQAKKIYNDIKENFPILITRDLNKAKEWLRENSRGSERYGLLASSEAIRLKPEGIYVRSKISPVNWFLKGKNDILSSFALEDVATEFEVQGLELDWTCVCWDGNMMWSNNKWVVRRLIGSKWQSVHQLDKKKYIKNSYRVLLTRARQGMIIFIPRGDERDETRLIKFYDGTYKFLMQCVGD